MALDSRLLLDAIHPAEAGTGYTVVGIPSGGRIEILYAESPEAGRRMADNLDRTARYQGIFHLVPVLGHRPKEGHRGTEADAVACWAVYGDMDALDCAPLAERLSTVAKDAKNVVWNAATPEERNAARAACRNLLDSAVARGDVPQPSALVDSGRGYHPYWILETAARGSDLALVKKCNASFAQILRSDSCFDLARVLRTPGTSHRKNPKDVLRCELIEFREQRYRLSDLLECGDRATSQLLFAPKASGESVSPVRSRKVTSDPGPVKEVPVPHAWTVHLERDQQTQDTWHGRRTDLKDKSRSVYAFAIAVDAVRYARITSIEDLVAIMRDCPSCAGWVSEKPKQARKTAAKVLELTGKRRAPDITTTVIYDGDDSQPIDEALIHVHGLDPDEPEEVLRLPRRAKKPSEKARNFMAKLARRELAPREIERWGNIAECYPFWKPKEGKESTGRRIELHCDEHGKFNEIPMCCSNNNTCPGCAHYHGKREADYLLQNPLYAGGWSAEGDRTGEGIALVVFDAGPEGLPTEKRGKGRGVSAKYRKGKRRKDGIQRSYLALLPKHLPALIEQLERDGVTGYTVMVYDPHKDNEPNNIRKLFDIAHTVYDIHMEPAMALMKYAEEENEEMCLDLMKGMRSKIHRTSGPRHGMPWYSESKELEANQALREAQGLPRKFDGTICTKTKADGSPCCRRGFHRAMDDTRVLAEGMQGYKVLQQAFMVLRNERTWGKGNAIVPMPKVRIAPIVSTILTC